ncbi:MAG: (4Fe-4S)-binding protein, partial [Peptostreptococcales bacterium]
MTDETKKTKREYRSDDLTIYWDLSLCSHSGKCINTLPQVFDIDKRPWISINGADTEEIIKTIDICPSGALQYKLNENSKVDPKLGNGPGSIDYKNSQSGDLGTQVTIRMTKAGPLLVKGPTKILSLEGEIL